MKGLHYGVLERPLSITIDCSLPSGLVGNRVVGSLSHSRAAAKLQIWNMTEDIQELLSSSCSLPLFPTSLLDCHTHSLLSTLLSACDLKISLSRQIYLEVHHTDIQLKKISLLTDTLSRR